MIPTTLQLSFGCSRDFPRQTPNDDGTFGGIYTGSETITWTVWPADSETAIASVAGSPNTWINAATTTWLISFSDAVSATIPPGFYRLKVTAPTSAGRTGVLFDGNLEVVDSAGASSPSPPDLISAPYAALACARLGLSSEQWQFLPYAIQAASAAVRRFCFDHYFLQANWVKTFEPQLDGTIRLDQVPVNQITRVQSSPDGALVVANSSAQNAQVMFAYTGAYSPYNPSAQTVTGLTFNWVTNGVPTTTSITYSANETIGSLATAINGLGSGWSATTTGTYSNWAVTELIGGFLAMDCTQGNSTNGAQLNVFSQGNTDFEFCERGQSTGLLWVGTNYGGLGPRWGPDWEMWDFSPRPQGGRVKVTWNAGYPVIPAPVQLATAEIVKSIINRLGFDLILANEKARDYSYTIAQDALAALPVYVRQGLSPYRLHYAG